jgi:hypothetical protein
MNKPQSAEELLANNIDGLKSVINDDDIFEHYRGVVIEVIQESQRQTIRYVLEKVAEKATVTSIPPIYGKIGYEVDKQSILSIESEIRKELGL